MTYRLGVTLGAAVLGSRAAPFTEAGKPAADDTTESASRGPDVKPFRLLLGLSAAGTRGVRCR